MSLTVLFFAVLHAAPTVLVAHYSNSRPATWVVGAITISIAVAIGGMAYDLIDLIAAGIGLWVGLGIIKPNDSVQRVKGNLTLKAISQPVLASTASAASNRIPGLVKFLLFIAAFPLWLYFLTSDSGSTANRPVPEGKMHAPVSIPQYPATSPPNVESESRSLIARKTAGSTRPQTEQQRTERCLRINDDRKMLACLEQLQ